MLALLLTQNRSLTIWKQFDPQSPRITIPITTLVMKFFSETSKPHKFEQFGWKIITIPPLKPY